MARLNLEQGSDAVAEVVIAVDAGAEDSLGAVEELGAVVVAAGLADDELGAIALPVACVAVGEHGGGRVQLQLDLDRLHRHGCAVTFKQGLLDQLALVFGEFRRVHWRRRRKALGRTAI